MPCTTGPTNETQEKLVMEALITDIKGKLAIDLDESPDTSRKIGTATEKVLDNFLVVGSSNARRLVAAGSAAGFDGLLITDKLITYKLITTQLLTT